MVGMTEPSVLRWRAAYACVGLAGTVALAAVARLPWVEPDFRVAAGARWTILLAGLLVLVVAARVRPVGADGPVGAALLVLGASVVAYPTLLTLAGAGVGDAVVATLGAAGHVLPLTMVQLLPVLVSGRVTGHPQRAWAGLVVAVAAVGATVTGLGLALGAAGGALLVLGTVLWFVSFAFAPIACWTAVRGTIGGPRRRGIVAGLAALMPVLVIVWCVTLGGLGSALGVGSDDTTTALLVGFSVATAGCALLSTAAMGEETSPLLRRSVVVGLLRVMVVAVVVLAASGTALATTALLPTKEASVLVAVVLTVVLGWVGSRTFGWAAEVVDPAAELRLELDRAGGLVAGQHRAVAEGVVRRLAEDSGAWLAFAVGDGVWVDVTGECVQSGVGRGANPGASVVRGNDVVVLACDEDGDSVLMLSEEPVACRHARAWGDCGAVLAGALLEAREAWQAGRAVVAADAERARLQQDLHDGLQGRLLGLALNLQMSQPGIGDPVARLTIEEAVSGLRGAVEDVRAMAGGRLPQVLVEEGLESALRVLLQPAGSRIGTLEMTPALADHRPPPAVEACAYYVVGEAVGNAIKHAGCEQIDVEVRLRDDDTVVVRVSDDGRGGADVRLGSGLRGLGERVEAHGGLLVVSDGPRGGTLVEAVLPCGR